MFNLQFASVAPGDVVGDQHAWPLQVTVTNSDNDTPAKVLVMQTAAGGVGVPDNFSCVASYPQMTELPEDAVGPDGPFYRVGTTTIIARSADHAVELRVKLQEAIQDLADNIAAGDVLTDESVILIEPS